MLRSQPTTVNLHSTSCRDGFRVSLIMRVTKDVVIVCPFLPRGRLPIYLIDIFIFHLMQHYDIMYALTYFRYIDIHPFNFYSDQ